MVVVPLVLAWVMRAASVAVVAPAPLVSRGSRGSGGSRDRMGDASNEGRGGSTGDMANQMFAMMDKNGDGKLSASEWSKGLTGSNRLFGRYFGDSTEEEHAAMFAMLDTDGNGDLSWDEFVAGAKRFAKIEPDKYARAATAPPKMWHAVQKAKAGEGAAEEASAI